MNIRFLPLLAALSLGTAALSTPAAEPIHVAFGAPGSTTTDPAAAADYRLACGASVVEVLTHLGEPTRQLPDGSWLYEQVRAFCPAGPVLKQDVLVLSFSHDRLTSLRLEKHDATGLAGRPQPANDGVLVAQTPAR